MIIYDEVHLLPAPVFRVTAELQAIRRVGLTATLVREDGCEGHVFSLVGPKRYDVPWKELEGAGWIASAECIELRIDLASEKEIEYATVQPRLKHRLASENPSKIPLVMDLVRHFKNDKILIIGQYLQQLHEIATLLNAPIITEKHQLHNAMHCTLIFDLEKTVFWLFPRLQTLLLIYLMLRWRYRFREPLGAGRKRRNVWVEFCGPKNAPRGFLRLLHGIPWKKNLVQIDKSFWRSRGMPMCF